MKNSKMKKSLSLILSLIMIMSTLSVLTVTSFAETSGDWEYSVNNNEASITKYNGSSANLTIPSKLDGYSVTSIGDDAFSSCTSLTSITIPDSVTSIGDGAFSDCTSLTSVTLGNSVTSIGYSTFSLCTSLTSITIPDSVTSIGSQAFSGCTSLTSINIPNSVTSIDGFAFRGCTSLTSITIPDSVTSIAGGAFQYCTSLTSITIPNSVTSIVGSTFCDCTSLTSVTLGNNVTSIGDFAFCDCTSLTSITIPDSVTSIGEYAFGYYYDTLDSLVKINDFKIYGRKGTEAENYAKNHDFQFIEIGTFPDVKEKDWFYDVVQYNAQKGFITGYQNGKFGPNDALKRQDFVCILARIDGADLSKYENVQSKLTDVKKGDYYAAAVNWAVDKGYISGYKNGKFGVNDPITREQVATILYNYMNKPTVTNATSILSKFPDANKVSSFAKTPVAWAVSNGIISGMGNGTVASTSGATRAQIAAIIQRMDTQGMFSK